MLQRQMFTATLRGNTEYIFRQSIMGSVGHIVVDGTEYTAALENEDLRTTLRIDTWCGRNYKYSNYSSVSQRSGIVRNACEYCFTEYDPDERPEQKSKRDNAKYERKLHQDSFPF